MKIAIITRADDRSPKILALSLSSMLDELSIEHKLFLDTGILLWIQPLTQKLKIKLSFFEHVYQKIKFRNIINKFLEEIKNYDLIILSECTPNGFWRGYYAIEKLRKIVKKPILFYEVYYLGNAPTQLEKLKMAAEPCIERYEWHLAVSDVTEIKSLPGNRWSRIGLNLYKSGLKPVSKSEFIVLVDFEQPGYESYRNEQIEILNELSIKYISLEKEYSIDEIRMIYRKACVLLIQFPEAFGLPIAECLACGAYIFTPCSSWPMGWRLDISPSVHSKGILPEVFIEYSSRDELKNKLMQIKNTYDLRNTPYNNFNVFTKHYPHFYYGDLESLKDALSKI